MLFIKGPAGPIQGSDCCQIEDAKYRGTKQNDLGTLLTCYFVTDKEKFVNFQDSVNPAPSPKDALVSSPLGMAPPVAIPAYLQNTYWWAYLHPRAVQFFERQWLVNLILWGNFSRLRDLALQELGDSIDQKVLQVACVYGDFTEKLSRRLVPPGSLDVIDVAPIQIQNLNNKLVSKKGVRAHLQDSTHLKFKDGHFDSTVLFFLLHEQPEEVRKKTIAEALRVTRPGGKLVFVDYHRPVAISPMRYLMTGILRALEPFAMDLWNQEIAHWLPAGAALESVQKDTYFGGLYQKLVIVKAAPTETATVGTPSDGMAGTGRAEPS